MYTFTEWHILDKKETHKFDSLTINKWILNNYKLKIKTETVVYKTWMLNRRLSLLLWNAAMPRLDHATRNNVIGRLHDGLSQSEVARQFNVEQSTIPRLWKRLNQTGLAQDRHRHGRPRITTPSQDRYIWVFHLRNRTVTAAGIPGLRRISTHTVCNRFRLRGIRPRRPYVGPVWTPALRRARVRWCPILKVWTGAEFGDESRFLLHRYDGRTRVYRRRNERFSHVSVQEVEMFGGGSVMMWTAISFNRKQT